MASVRLTVSDRDKIVAGMLRHRFTKEAEKLSAELAAFAVAVYEDVYKPKDRAAMAALPKGWLPERSFIAVKFADKFANLSFGGGVYGLLRTMDVEGKREDRRFLSKHHHCAAVYDATHRLASRHETIAQQEAALKASIRDAQRQAHAAIATVNTTARLKEIWPEAGPFVQSLEGVTRPLPAVPTAKLNAMLGLPVSEGA